MFYQGNTSDTETEYRQHHVQLYFQSLAKFLEIPSSETQVQGLPASCCSFVLTTQPILVGISSIVYPNSIHINWNSSSAVIIRTLCWECKKLCSSSLS